MQEKKLETIEVLMKNCSNSYKNFTKEINNALSKDYHNFKVSFREDCFYLMKEIAISMDHNLTLELLCHFKEQLDFINQNSLSAKDEDFDMFMKKNYPYVEKIRNIKSAHVEKNIKPSKMKA
jgi:hypothetical protein